MHRTRTTDLDLLIVRAMIIVFVAVVWLVAVAWAAEQLY
ncbi:ornithine carbamoyltransferase [Sagittula stellata E-37]|uniref:Ornithine carbamoyltransferase n=1 Tax=Sagittula stellata (strain ATCC 700073 / DSM 11524 / E-37) TaxID=388399 RepID=A3K6Z8_SAGS3|nr:ornithine carbamoyltransferase [Sagittula stellata E-37]